MSFYSDVEANPKANQVKHIPKEVRTKLSGDKGTIKHEIALPPTNYFCGIQRQKPQTGFAPTGLIANNSQLDYWLGCAGFVEKIVLELSIQINPSAANPVQLLPPYLIDHIEICDSSQNIMQTIYPDMMFLDRINWTIDKANFQNPVEGVSSTYGPLAAMAAGTIKTYELTIPCWINQVQPKINTVSNRLLIRVFFSTVGVISGASTDVFVNVCDIIQHAEQLSGPLESMETMDKKKRDLQYRVLNPIRVAQQSYPMTASSSYDIQLTSANEMSAFMFFVVRPTPINSANVLSYTNILAFELYDNQYTLQGIRIGNENNNAIIAQRFFGDIFHSTIGQNIYVMPFCLDVGQAFKGVQCGFYKFNTTEILRIYTSSTFTAGNYIVDVYSYNYAVIDMDHGEINLER